MIIIFLGSSGMHGITNKLTLGKGHHFFQSFGWQAHGVPAPRPCGTPKQCPWAARLFQALPLQWCFGSATSLFALHGATGAGLAACFKFYRKKAAGWRPCPPGRPQWGAVCGGSNWLLACGIVGGAHRHLHCGLQPKTAGQAPHQAHPHFSAFSKKRPSPFGLCRP